MKTLIIIVVIALTATCTMAQKADSSNRTAVNAELIMKDGSILRGVILRELDTTVLFRGDLVGELYIPRSKILDIKYYLKTEGNTQTYINLNSRYYFSPSALNLKKGDGYFQITYISLATVNYAFTNNFSCGAGFELFTLLFGHPLFFFTPKVSFELDKNFHIGAGYMFVGLLNAESESFHFNMGYANMTMGDNDYNLSVNVGTDLEYAGKPVFTVNGFVRLGTKFGLMTENWFIPTSHDYYNLHVIGGRVIGRKNLFDFGILTNADFIEGGIIGLPFFSYTLRF